MSWDETPNTVVKTIPQTPSSATADQSVTTDVWTVPVASTFETATQFCVKIGVSLC